MRSSAPSPCPPVQLGTQTLQLVLAGRIGAGLPDPEPAQLPNSVAPQFGVGYPCQGWDRSGHRNAGCAGSQGWEGVTLRTQGRRWHCHPPGQCCCGSPSVPIKPGAGAAAPPVPRGPAAAPQPGVPHRALCHLHAQFPISLQQLSHPRHPAGPSPAGGCASLPVPLAFPEDVEPPAPRGDLSEQSELRGCGAPGWRCHGKRRRGERSAITGEGAAPRQPRHGPAAVFTALGAVPGPPAGHTAGATLRSATRGGEGAQLGGAGG